MDAKKLNELLNCFDREVALVKRPSGEYQIMGRQYAGYWHIFPGQLWTLEEAKAKCEEIGATVVAVGDEWECLKV